MWLHKERYEELIKAAAQLELMVQGLAAAEKRAVAAEEALTAERAAKDWLAVQLASRVITKHGGYGLEQERAQPSPAPHPRGFTHEPTVMDLAKLEFYKQCAAAAGKDEQDAIDKWEQEMRGEELQIESEVEQ